MKKINVSATIEKLAPITMPDGSPVYRNGRLRSHRLILSKSASFEKAIAECENLERADGQKKSFCLKRDDGKYAMDLTPQQVQLLLGGRMNVPTFALVAKGTTFNATIELRSPGDVYIDRRTKEEGVVGENGFAQVQDMSADIAPHVLDRILQYTVAATINVAPSFAAPSTTAPATEHVAGDEGDAAAEGDEPIAGAQAAPAADTRKRVATTAKAAPRV